MYLKYWCTIFAHLSPLPVFKLTTFPGELYIGIIYIDPNLFAFDVTSLNMKKMLNLF